MKKGFYIIGIIAFGLTAAAAIGNLWVTFKYSPSKDTVRGNTDIHQIPAESVSAEFYLSEITNFYGNVITILYSTIGILLVIGFVYVYTTSRAKAEDLARQALKEETFEIALKERIEKSLTKLKNEGEIGELLGRVSDFEARIDFLEKAITSESYEIKQVSDTKDAGEQSNGHKKKI